MENAVRSYAWGSTTLLPSLRGGLGTTGSPPSEGPRAESAQPEAEVWMGSHPGAPSTLIDATGRRFPLDLLCREQPAEILGTEALALLPPGEPEPGLPFLFKILTAAQGLSIQAHPSRDQAARGFAREEAAGIPHDAPHRNYRDRNHKPELICALSHFWGLRGFRPHTEIARDLQPVVALLGELARTAGASEACVPLLRAFDAFLAHPDAERWEICFGELLHAGENSATRALLVEAGERVARGALDSPMGETEEMERDNRHWWVGELLRQFPGDPGALAPFYLELVHLSPGEAIYLDAGLLHAYLYGAGVEIMANSDNVLRSGCTPKHVDSAELQAVLTFAASPSGLIAPQRAAAEGCLIERFETPAAEFELVRVTTRDEPAQLVLHLAPGPAVLLALDRVTVREGAQPAEERAWHLAPTESLFVDHRTTAVTVDLPAHGHLFVAALPGACRRG